MDETTAKASQADVRILTLKRWNFPQTTRLFSEKEEGPSSAEDYISYNSHHFIHIEECDGTDEQLICRAYKSLKELRVKQRNTKNADIHMVQSLTLLGNKSDFWDHPSNVMYISFLQLTNNAGISMEDIRKNISSIIDDRAPDASWALYHSLDFCDFVLFAKNLTYADCNNIMWDLAIVRGTEFSILRDTFTIYGFRQGFLIDAFQKFGQGQSVEWKESASLSLRLSIQSQRVWKQFKDNLRNENIHCDFSRTFGRYDVRVDAENLPGAQILKLLYLLDKTADESKDNTFGGYEISISIEEPLDGTGSLKPTDATQNRELEDAATKAMDYLLPKSIEASPDSADYVDETQRSLKALLKNGFSEEFVLSVLPTFLGFLKITIDIQNYRNDISLLPTEEEYYLKESQEKMTRRYFNALNILALCTMHSERQFVQAPAFNVTYFEVPPKLLTFYSAIAWEILEAMRDKGDAYYHFLFVPNYRKDINVRPLELEMRKDLPQHIAVAYLHESYFYDPVLTIKLFCHEAAHYMSDRHREQRAKYIFRVVSFLLLTYTPVCSVVNEKGGLSLLEAMSSSLADLLEIKFKEHLSDSTRGIKYHLEDVSNFLRDNECGIAFFRNPFDAYHICGKWKKVLHENVNQPSDNRFVESFRAGLSSIQETLQSDYLTSLFQNDQEEMYVYEVFSRVIAHYASFPDNKSPNNDCINLCEHIIQAFSEAYADLRMGEILGEKFSQQDYDAMLKQTEAEERTSYQQVLRRNAVLQVLAPNAGRKTEIPVEDFSISYAISQIAEYLRLCHKNPIQSDKVEEVLRAFKECDASKQCDCIRKTIQDYREKLTQYCEKIANNNDVVSWQGKVQ